MAVNDASLQSVQAQTIRIQGHSPARADSRVFPLAFFTPRTPEIVEPVDPRSVARKRSRAGGAPMGAIFHSRGTAGLATATRDPARGELCGRQARPGDV